MARVELTVTVKKVFAYRAEKYAGYGMEWRYIYVMASGDETIYVWKTTTIMGYETVCDDGHNQFNRINEGDVVRIKATIKGYSEYNGQPQTLVTRVVVIDRTFKAKTPEEIQKEKEEERRVKREAQLNSIADGDHVWEMPYKQYKERYADCETLIDSYKERNKSRPALITVIIRSGRLKNSGVRGKHFHSFAFGFIENGRKYTAPYVAVDDEHAKARFEKDHPGIEYEIEKIYW